MTSTPQHLSADDITKGVAHWERMAIDAQLLPRPEAGTPEVEKQVRHRLAAKYRDSIDHVYWELQDAHGEQVSATPLARRFWQTLTGNTKRSGLMNEAMAIVGLRYEAAVADGVAAIGQSGEMVTGLDKKITVRKPLKLGKP